MLRKSLISFYRKCRYIGVTHRTMANFGAKSTAHYSPPQSKLTQFIKQIHDIQNTESMLQAAQSMAHLQADEAIYSQKLLQIQADIKSHNEQSAQIVEIVRRQKNLSASIKSQIEENKAIQTRCKKQLQNIKIYGVSRIAKDVIQISDHLTQSIVQLQQGNTTSKQSNLRQLHNAYQQLSKLLQKYQIVEFNPKNQIFNPHEHESIGHIPTEDPTKINIVAEVKRTGFKLKDRLLRSAFVVIYK